MNLELLDPFGRQIPDRVDATLSLPAPLHFRQLTAASASGRTAGGAESGGGGKSSSGSSSGKKSKQSSSSQQKKNALTMLLNGDDQEWRAAYHLSFNRRGTYLAVGYGSGAVAVFNLLSRGLASLYQSDVVPGDNNENNGENEGVTSVTWSRRSRTLMSGAAGDFTVKVHDTTHPFGPEECCKGLGANDGGGSGGGGAGGGSSASAGGGGGGGDDVDDDAEPIHRNAVNRKDRSASSGTAGGPQNQQQVYLPGHSVDKTKHTSFEDADLRFSFSQERRTLKTESVKMGHRVNRQRVRRPEDCGLYYYRCTTTADTTTDESERKSGGGDGGGVDSIKKDSKKNSEDSSKFDGIPLRRHSCVSFDFKTSPVGGTLQVNPRIRTGGVAALADGTLILFYFHPSAFVSGGSDEKIYPAPKATVVTLCSPTQSSSNVVGVAGSSNDDLSLFKLHITCAAFDHHGERVYAATKDGALLGYDVSDVWKALQASCYYASSKPDPSGSTDGDGGDEAKDEAARTVPVVTPKFHIKNACGTSSAWHLLVSRNGKYLVVNSSDGALRLFSTHNCWNEPDKVDKPLWQFQDVVSKVKFACCDLSGDGEYVVGGANGDDNKYELYVWNTTTGALMDKLSGSSVQLYGVAWHPTRSFIAAATSDGLVDVWGPRINWTAFAPDFQALQMNVEYIEREDEFDVDEEGRYLMELEMEKYGKNKDDEEEDVDVLTVDKVPVFASDSEDEEEVFSFETKVINLLAERGRPAKGKTSSMDD